MVTKLPKTDVVIIGVGWAGGIIASELTKKGLPSSWFRARKR